MNFGGIFDIAKQKARIEELEKLTTKPDFWNDNEKAQEIFKEINQIKTWTEPWDALY